jgi:hypothetical protein
MLEPDGVAKHGTKGGRIRGVQQGMRANNRHGGVLREHYRDGSDVHRRRRDVGADAGFGNKVGIQTPVRFR